MLETRHLLLFSAALFSSSVFAGKHVVIAPNCLTATTKNLIQPIATSNNLSLFSTNDAGIKALMHAKEQQKSPCGGFRDVTQEWLAYKADPVSFIEKNSVNTFVTKQKKSAYKIQYPKDVEQLIKQINPQSMWDQLTTLTQFKDRYANSQDGVEASIWLKRKMLSLVKESKRTDVSSYFVKTGNQYKQSSLVVKIGKSDEPGIVISAHIDTVPATYSNKPGADDDGSGSATILEAARTVLSSGIKFKKPIYFIWYAAEEEGLVGSGFVVRDFKKKKLPVDAVLHYDLTGYAHHNEPTMYLITDNVDPNLTDYLGSLITTYVKRDVKRTACGYACSDHATWTHYGYKAAISAESAYEDTNPNIHSTNDTMDKLSLEHMTDYTKLAVAFAVELAEPQS